MFHIFQIYVYNLTIYTTKKRELARCSLHEQRPWQAHLIETNNIEAHADMIPYPYTELDTLLA